MDALNHIRDNSSSVAGVVTGLTAGFLIKTIFPRLNLPFLPRSNNIEYDTDDGDDDDDEYDDGDDNVNYNRAASASTSNEPHKLVFCVRTDLKMQRGKIAAQVGHATLGAYKTCAKRNPHALRVWERNAQPKIALQISSLKDAKRLEENGKKLGLVTYMVFDAGRTQIVAVSS